MTWNVSASAGAAKTHVWVSTHEPCTSTTGSPVPVITGEYTGLPIPATAEIVVEAEAIPGQDMDEGPFGEWTGYYASSQRAEPIMKVKRLYHRNDPIILGAPPTRPPCEFNYMRGFMRSALIWQQMEAAGVPDVTGVWCHEAGGARLLTIVSIKQRYPGHARQAGHILNQCGVGAYMSRYSVVVDEDIDPSNLQEVMWAVATRTDPALDIDIIQRGMGSKNDPMYVAYPYDAPFSSKAIIDACRPWDHLEEFPAVAEASKELQERIRARWKDLF